MVTKIQIMTLNEIISCIYKIDNLDEMRQHTLEEMRYIIPYSFASFYIADPRENKSIYKPVGVDIELENLEKYMENIELDYSKPLFSNGRSMVYKESDIFPPEDVINTDYYTIVYEQNNIIDSLTMSIGDHGRFLGVITLFRGEQLNDFIDDEVFIMSLLLCHYENRLSKEYLKELHKNNFYSEEELEKIKKEYNLTNREDEILELLLKGKSIDEICQICSISNNTLRKHIMNIYRKLGIHSRPELANLFYR